MLCLGIETSCDETAIALVADGQCIGSILGTQAPLHALFGGVVPELASREHYRCIGPLYDKLMSDTNVVIDDLDIIAVTRGPGLLGALLVGLAFAKGLAIASDKPLIGINHLHAHLLVADLEEPIEYPALGLLVSGGHTHIYKIDAPDAFVLLARTLDDAAGEACDKFAKMLGLPYPGGSIVDILAQQGIADPYLFPRPYTSGPELDFSFSGLKTAAAMYLKQYPQLVEEGRRYCSGDNTSIKKEFYNVCASYLLAISETLYIKMERALHKHHHEIKTIIVAGGLAANTFIRQSMYTFAANYNRKILLPKHKLCTDNAVMVAYSGELLAKKGYTHNLDVSAIPRGQYIPNDMIKI